MAHPARSSAAREGLPIGIAADVVDAIAHRPMKTFDLSHSAIVGPAGVEGRVIVRIAGQVWSLNTVDAALAAIVLRNQVRLRGAGLFADALQLACREAEGRVAAVHAWMGR